MCAMAGEWGQLTWHPRGLIAFRRNKLPKVETLVQCVITNDHNPEHRGALT